ncbi:hypothetical protein GM661_11765 [Iocasia frigidifontis]|uniref:Uncharacterized protein n=1 Tax=Iocasia fonsfrigidae TaxID=2682810 RepID=A0A8A7KAW4_9FIRM|nr:DUF6672 family protein [Iocasia fonsfrigidae]QTL98591.1 hypothetical protein GM661_11765 [Iocasia fonsfrigidae]
MKKKIIFRAILVVFLIMLGIIFFIIGKEHKVFIDNRDLTIAGKTFTAAVRYEVWVDGEKLSRTTLNPGKRNVVYLAGPQHKIVLQEIKEGKAVGKEIEKDINLSLDQTQVIINIPALVAGSDLFLYQDK